MIPHSAAAVRAGAPAMFCTWPKKTAGTICSPLLLHLGQVWGEVPAFCLPCAVVAGAGFLEIDSQSPLRSQKYLPSLKRNCTLNWHYLCPAWAVVLLVGLAAE